MATSLPPPWFLQNCTLVSEEQKKEIQLYLQTAHDQLHDVRYRINQLQRQEEELTAQIDRCKVAIAPHKRLPADILRYTFTICLDEYSVFPLSKDKNNVLLVLTHVCSAWRKIALETSSFWSNIAIAHYPKPTQGHTFNNYRGLFCWVNRAAGRALSFKIYDASGGPFYLAPIRSSGFIGFATLLLEELNYRKLDIRIDFMSLLLLKSHIPPDRLRQLEALTLISTHYGALSSVEELTFPPDTAFESLTSLKLKCDLDLRSSHIQSVIPWKNLRELVLLQLLPPVIALEVLQQTRVLEHCQILLVNEGALSISELIAEVQRVQVHLQHLQTLCLSCVEARDVEMFMDQLVLPALEYVTCDRVQGLDARTPDNGCGILNAVVRLSKRSGTPKVKEVHAYTCLSGSQFQDLLRSMPYLRVIRFNTVTFDDDTLERLSTGELGPFLTKLEAYLKHDEDDSKIADMLRRRRECSRALSKEITPTFVLKHMYCFS